MFRYLQVVPLAAESLGVRSMCTYVKTPDVRILLDAGASLCPNRFGLPPHPLEFEAIIECRKQIADAAEKAEVVTISHYHFDHHTPSYEDWLCTWTETEETARHIYAGKTVLIKNPREKINFSQRRRAWVFQRTGGKYAKRLEVADGQSFVFDNTRIKFSEPVFHGSENSFSGWVLMATIEFGDEKVVFAPDVQGPISMQSLELIVNEKPTLAIVGGPPLYLSGFKVDEEHVKHGLINLEKIVQVTPCTILEHHILRSEKWRESVVNVFEKAKNAGHKVLTAAEYLGKINALLEARRKTLFIEKPPSKEFENWMTKSELERRKNKPPCEANSHF